MNSSLYLAAFGGGLLASLSPCVYPMIPLTLGYLGSSSSGSKAGPGRWRVILFFVGQVLVFTTLGIAAVQLGEVFGFSGQNAWVQFFTGVLMLLFAWVSISPKMSEYFSMLNSKLPQTSSRGGIFAPLVVGGLSALIASPCSSPILGAVLTNIATQGSIYSGIIQMFLFSAGMSLIFLVLGLGFAKIQSLPRAGNWMRKAHFVSVGLMLLGAVYFFWQFSISIGLSAF